MSSIYALQVTLSRWFKTLLRFGKNLKILFSVSSDLESGKKFISWTLDLRHLKA